MFKQNKTPNHNALEQVLLSMITKVLINLHF